MPDTRDGPNRLFFALWPEPALARTLAAWARDVQPACGGRLMRPDSLHITLAFLGAATSAQTRELLHYTHQCRLTPGSVRISRYGCFKRPRIIWAGPEAGHTALAEMHETLWRDLTALGWSRPEQGFTPHVTLLRHAERFELPAAPGELDWPYAHLSLIASDPGGQARYRELARSR
ncbi:RNA 2',3'-cyclic phosphodiesterase [Bordetella genomosp. 12]|uniref:RNA 2',3'-cyclic phosphodiesterase n=1 Tax=Bordetella genomosp. 12 TaxID=463035 RepID=A0A261VCU0_9BORD|nr:RNA 2',3'-cyclic phosphodiesterase [Bordetella genomosp. 12]OZI71919.1 2'-5' RNA ligase [Bordetella genomosp. 12]